MNERFTMGGPVVTEMSWSTGKDSMSTQTAAQIIQENSSKQLTAEEARKLAEAARTATPPSQTRRGSNR